MLSIEGVIGANQVGTDHAGGVGHRVEGHRRVGHDPGVLGRIVARYDSNILKLPRRLLKYL